MLPSTRQVGEKPCQFCVVDAKDEPQPAPAEFHYQVLTEDHNVARWTQSKLIRPSVSLSSHRIIIEVHMRCDSQFEIICVDVIRLVHNLNLPKPELLAAL